MPDERTADDYRTLLWRAMRAALAAVEPEGAVLRACKRDGDVVHAGRRAYDLAQVDRIVLIGAGKAGAPMAKAVVSLLGERLSACVVNVKRGYVLSQSDLADMQARCACPIEFFEAGHPTPDSVGVRGAQRITEVLRNLTPRDLVICVISGGGSALMTLPAPGISLDDMQQLTNLLLASGASINEMNCVRKHLELLKGGGLARLAQPASVLTLVLSDVVGNPLDVIASGPTVPDSTTFAQALAVLDKYGLVGRVPAAITQRLKAGAAGALPETPKAGDVAFQRVNNVIVGSNELAAQAAVDQARQDGLQTLLLTTFLEGEAREVAKVAAGLAKDMHLNDRPLAKPGLLVAGGETTVTLRGRGKGGRNQELALAAALALEGWQGVLLAALATDGSDGPTDAAGAIVSGDTIESARQKGLDGLAYLKDNDSYSFFRQSGDLIVTGPTNTNVNDLLFILAF